MDIGDMGVPFIYQGEELIYPEYVKDGLVLHYDFSGMTNNDASKDIARDLSGNGNHGTLQNFNFTPESGYDKNKLLFDGVDDGIVASPPNYGEGDFTMEVVMSSEGHTGTNILFAHSTRTSSIFNVNSFGICYIFNPLNPRFIYYADGIRNLVDIGLEEKFPRTHIILQKKGLSVSAFVNGEEVYNETHETLQTSEAIEKDYRLGTGSWTTVGSARAYNRALSPEEIAHNYAIEKERFSIE